MGLFPLIVEGSNLVSIKFASQKQKRKATVEEGNQRHVKATLEIQSDDHKPILHHSTGYTATPSCQGHADLHST